MHRKFESLFTKVSESNLLWNHKAFFSLLGDKLLVRAFLEVSLNERVVIPFYSPKSQGIRHKSTPNPNLWPFPDTAFRD